MDIQFTKSITEHKYQNRENFQMDRFADGLREEQRQNHFINERNLFNQNSNGQEENLDFSHFKVNDYEIGMPLQSTTIFKNKKSLLSKPLIQIEQTNAPIENSNFDNSHFFMIKQNNEEKNIERGIVEFEFNRNLNKSIMHINTPFSLSYVWKTLLLLSKYPTNEKLLNILNIKNKNLILQSIKDGSSTFNNYSKLYIIIPNNCVVNNDYINKINSIYNIYIINKHTEEDNILINITTNYELKIPTFYNPSIIHSNFCNNLKTKFIKLENVFSFLSMNENIINIEIPLLNNTSIGFIYNTHKQNIYDLNYDNILEEKPINHIIKKLIIPKFTTKQITNYGKKFDSILTDFHIGEIIYGKLFKLNIVQDLNLTIMFENTKNINNVKIQNIIQSININHSHFFYIKENKNIIISGVFNI